MKEFFSLCSSEVEGVSIHNNGLSDIQLKDILDVVNDCLPKLKYVSICLNEFGPKSSKVIQQIIETKEWINDNKVNEEFEELHIISCKIIGTSLSSLFDYMNKEKSIKKLTLNNLRMSKLALNEMCKVMASSSMTELDISMNGLFHGANIHHLKHKSVADEENIEESSESDDEGDEECTIEDNKEIEHNRSRAIKNKLKTTSSAFRSSLEIGQEKIINSISQMILNSGNLIHMNLNETGIQGEALKFLIINVVKSFSLCSIHLCGNNISHDDYEFICDTMNLRRLNSAIISEENDQDINSANVRNSTIDESDTKDSLILTRIVGHSSLTTGYTGWRESSDCWICSKYTFAIIFWRTGANDEPPKIKGEFTDQNYESMISISEYCLTIDKSFRSNVPEVFKIPEVFIKFAFDINICGDK